MYVKGVGDGGGGEGEERGVKGVIHL